MRLPRFLTELHFVQHLSEQNSAEFRAELSRVRRREVCSMAAEIYMGMMIESRGGDEERRVNCTQMAFLAAETFFKESDNRDTSHP